MQITSTKVFSAIGNKTIKTLSIENEWQRKRLSLRKAETLLSILFCANSTVATYVFRLQSRADYYEKSKKLDKSSKSHTNYTQTIKIDKKTAQLRVKQAKLKYNKRMDKKTKHPSDEQLNRAAQFLPFDALQGLREELNKREEKHLRTAKMQLSDDRQEELGRQLLRLSQGQRAIVVFYYNGHYLEAEGVVSKINFTMKTLTMGEKRIPFDDIYDIRLID